jgi:hypothetical protein
MDYGEANDIVHNVDLERVLLRKGVSAEHIAYLKNKYPHDFDEYYDYYEHISENDEKNALIETKKIVGISRTNINASFYDNAAGRCKSELNVYRMAEAINHICGDTLEQLYTWYENLYDPVALIYFSDEDVYKVGRDGNHRALYANIIGAPLIKAEVAYYRRNEVNYNTFLYFKEVCSKYALESIESDYYNHAEVTFRYNDEEYAITGYTNPEKNGRYCIERINKLADQLKNDFRYLENDQLIGFWGKHPLIADICLKFLSRDSAQVYRLYQHIHERNKLRKSK